MARAQLTFRQGDVTRAIRAARAAGVPVGRIEIDRNGRIVIIAGIVGDLSAGSDANEWDDVLQ